jgi:RNA polymerase sigma-70 factor, ECF subfamily
VEDTADAALVAATLDGDLNAYGVLVRRYQDTYFRFAMRMLGDREDADDALQSAFVRAFRALRDCRNPARFAAWLYQIVINECRTLGSRRTRRERRIIPDEGELESRAVEHPEGSSAEMEEIQRAIDQLEPESREAFVLKHVEELSYDEMAALTGAGISALKMRVKRACDRLRELMEESRRAT